MWRKVNRIHFVGIGGAGMSGIAEVLLTQGYQISGSDLKPSPATDRLESLGAKIFLSHAAEHAAGADVLVVSTAVRPDNVEVRAARAGQVPVIPRAEMLAELMRLKYGIAVAGAHGKTTTTSMIGAVLAYAGWDPTMVVGGRVRAMGSHARLGRGEFLVAEADESDKSFLTLSPTYAIVTNIDREHLDCYRDLDEISDCFVQFINKVPFYGCSILNLDDPNLTAILPRIQRRMRTYGLEAAAEFTASAIDLGDGFHARFSVRHAQQLLGQIELQVSGRHNVSNALSVVALGVELGLSFDEIAGGLREFRGVDRRFQVCGRIGEILVVDDYGHHPTEIAATLAAARACARRVLVLFQPHRYSRTMHLADQFASAFGQADRVWIADIYPAGEEAIPGISSPWLVEKVSAAGHPSARHATSLEAGAAEMIRDARPGDLLLTLGAGNVHHAAEWIMKQLMEDRPQQP
ncbi:MAG: UDP-N-acetylmuramate--L-alanine ligase [Acidobacteria bacterium]|nr:UDP-N-acetylmuramate--L-alanine ligase [Acidobacteriota bacterium]